MARLKTADREQIRGETRQLLLDAAAEEFAREGYTGANINRISQQAGFAKGTVYNYFPSKRELMLALIEEVAAAHLAYIAIQVREEEDPRRRLVRFFEAGYAFVAEHLSQGRAIVTTLYGPDEQFKAAMFAAYQPMFRLVAEEIIGPGVAQGVFRPVDPAAMAGLLMTVYLGTSAQVDETGRSAILPAQVADFALHALDPLHGGHS